ncbi:MAG: T9SS type A sorting domain-containing protein [Bacteroidia bacterium]
MKGLIILSFLFTAVFMKGQPPQRFYGKFGGSGIDIGYGVKQTLDRNYIVVGSTSSYGAGNTDVYLVKVDSMGWTTWQKTFGGFGNDVGRSVIQLPDSSYVIAGFTNSYGAGGYDALIIKTDKNGNFLWQKTFGGTDWDFAYDLVYTSDAHIVICGSTTSFGHGNKDGFMAKYDPSGILVWQKFFGGVQDDELKSLISTNDGKLAAVGNNMSLNDINGDGYFLKTDLNGDTLFTRNVGGPYKDLGNDLVQKSNGDYVIAGAKTYSQGVNPEAYMYGMDVNGTFLWDNHYTSSVLNDGFVSVANSYQLPTFTGYLRDMSFPGNKVQGESFITYPGGWSYKVNAFGGTQDEHCYSMEGTLDGGFVTVGTTESFGSINSDVFFIKQDSTIINYSSIVLVKENENKELKPMVFLWDNVVNVIFDKETEGEILILDVTGKLIQIANVTSDKVKLNISSLPPSVYFVSVKIKTGETYTSRVVKTD